LRFPDAVRLAYCWALTGYYKSILARGKYDIVQIHGCGFNSEIWIQLCKRMNQKYVITLHGLNSFSETIAIDEAGKRYERDFLRRVTQGEIPITVISSGIKRIIENTYNVNSCSNISVVLNAFSFSAEMQTTENIRAKYNIPASAKLLLYVGNISKNKNQIQLVRAFSKMDRAICNNTYVLFAGNPQADNSDIENEISNSLYREHLVLCGGIDKTLMPAYFKTADGVVLLSWAEGFGLGLAEGMHFGIPCATFTDLDAFTDLYHEDVMIPISDRSDEQVAKSIELLLTKKWDRDAIKAFSTKFESDAMADNYIKTFKNIICE
jgi:glycosyltransferase involved in cell wall biosynthesis